jgi:hypothetical protein
MKNLISTRTITGKVFFILLITLTSTVSVLADKAYLHALSNLRTARWLIDRSPEGAQKTDDQVAAVKAIDLAMARIINADIDDGKYLNDRPDEDAIPDRDSRLAVALQLLRKAHADVNNDDGSAFDLELKSKEIPHINEAIACVEKAILTKSGSATSSK